MREDDRFQWETALAGLPAYLESAQVVGLRASVERHVRLWEGGQGRSDGEVVDDLRIVERD